MNNKEEIKDKIIDILTMENRPVSISEIAKLLKEKGIERSQPLIKKYLEELKRGKKVLEEK